MVAIPMMIDLKGKQVLIVGGGRIAERKVNTLIEAEAIITIISPEIRPYLLDLHNQGIIEWKCKKFSPKDSSGAYLVIAATNDSEVNQFIIETAPVESLTNAVEDADKGNVHFPATVRRGRLTIAISTNSASPLFAKKIKNQLEDIFDESYQKYVDFLYESRDLLKKSSLSLEERKEILHHLLNDEFKLPNKQAETIKSLKKLTE